MLVNLSMMGNESEKEREEAKKRKQNKAGQNKYSIYQRMLANGGRKELRHLCTE